MLSTDITLSLCFRNMIIAQIGDKQIVIRFLLLQKKIQIWRLHSKTRQFTSMLTDNDTLVTSALSN